MFQEFHKKLDIDDRSTRPYHPMAKAPKILRHCSVNSIICQLDFIT